MIKKLRVQVPSGAVGKSFSPELTFCVDSYSVSPPPHVTTVACKRPRSFCQKCRWQVTLNHAYTLNSTKSEWADYALQAECGNARPQSSHLAEPLWNDPGIKSGISVRELISTLEEEEKSAGGKWMVEHIPRFLANEENATTTNFARQPGQISVLLFDFQLLGDLLRAWPEEDGPDIPFDLIRETTDIQSGVAARLEAPEPELSRNRTRGPPLCEN